MKPEAQRIAIAEACGWKFSKIKGEFRYVSIPPDGVKISHTKFGEVGHLPDYLNDLNAMHEAEKVLTAEQARQYDKEQQRIGFRERLAGAFWMWHLPAEWKAEAFLKTIGKWEDAK